MTKTKFQILKMRRERLRRKKNKKIFIISVFAIVGLTCLFVNKNRDLSKMEYGTVVGNSVVCDKSSNEYIIYDNNDFYTDEKVIVIHKNGDIDIKPAKYRVESGDNLWDIASDYCNDEIDARIYIEKIKECNDNIDDYQLRVGDVINMPI